MEAKHGSLGRAMLAARAAMARASKTKPRPLFTSLKEGMQQMVDALVAALDAASLKTETPVRAISPEAGGWVVSAGLQSDQFDAVIVALPTHAAAALLQRSGHDLSAELAAIQYSSSVTVAIGYNKQVRDTLPPGFGFLVPRSEGKRMLAATFVHNKFPHRAPDDRAILRCFLGGARGEQMLALSEDQILAIVRQELDQILGLKAEPLFTRVFKWKGAMAQYGVGHLDRLERIETLRKKLPGLALAGNGYSGIGVPDCVRTGTAAVDEVLNVLGVVSLESVPAQS
jgi:oxygen-dependent protoporphyrinogen oxidase